MDDAEPVTSGSKSDAAAQGVTPASESTQQFELPARSEPLSAAAQNALGLTELGSQIVHRIRSGEPVRRPAPGGQNWAGAMFLDLMGFTVGIESRTLERPYYRLVTRQKDLIEIYDQPYTLRRVVRDKTGKELPNRDHVPDALCIRNARVHFTECKPWAKLEEISERHPDMYCLTEDGRWRSPAAERALEGTGIGYEVFTDRDINVTLLRNVSFLHDFERDAGPGETALKRVADILRTKPIATIEELVEEIQDRRTIYCAIAHGHVLFDVERDLVSDDLSSVFRDKSIWNADKILRINPPKQTIKPSRVNLAKGSPVVYEGHAGEVLDCDNKTVWIRTDAPRVDCIPRSNIVPLLLVKRLVWQGEPRQIGALARERIAEATVAELDRAIEVYKSLEPWLSRTKQGGTTRTIRRRIAEYRKAESIFGHGFVGLLDRIKSRGNRRDRLTQKQEELLDTYIREQYLENARSIDGTLALLNPALKEVGEERVARKTLKRRIDRIPPAERERLRHGTRMANSVRPPHSQAGEPPKGERAFAVGHIDSLSVPMEVLSRRTGQVIRPPLWATLLWNAYPPYPLGVSLQFEKPSKRSVMGACRDCVKRNNRLPDVVYHDLGGEHKDLTFDLMKAEYDCDFMFRPGGNARFGADIETHIGNFKTWIRECIGSYKVLPRRGGTASHDPTKITQWYAEEFFELFEHLLFDDWPDMGHEGIATTPRILWQKSMVDQGNRPERFIAYDESFQTMTMPIVKAAARIHPTRGIRYQYVWYHASDLDDPTWHNKDVALREPVDESHIIVQLGSSWVRCDPVSYVFRLFSHREQSVLLKEWRAEARQTNSQERLNPDAFERFMRRVADEEHRFQQTQPAGHDPQNPAPTTEEPKASNGSQTPQKQPEEEVDDFSFTPAPMLN